MTASVTEDSLEDTKILSVDEISQRQRELDEKMDSIRTIGVSDMASQFYCEKKLDLRLEHGEVDNQFKQRGREGHRAVKSGYEGVQKEDAWRSIQFEPEVTLQEFPLRYMLDDFLLRGRSDLIHFEDGKPRVLLEVKFVHGSVQDTFRNEKFQPWIYSRMLDGIGFETSELTYAVLKTGANNRERIPYIERIRDDAIEMILNRYPDESMTEFKDRTFVFPQLYRREDWEEEFEWALKYWRDKRSPKPTDNEKKCLSCDYEEHCDESNI